MQSLVEISFRDVNRRTLQPTRAAVERLARVVARKGSVDVPGWALIPETRHLVSTATRARTLQVNIMRALLAYLRETDEETVRPQRYVDLSGRRAAAFYADAALLVDDRWKVFPGNKTARQGGSQFHFDDLRTIFSSLCYRGRNNAVGGTLQIIDLLRFAKDTGVPVQKLVSFQRLSLGIGGGYKNDEHCPLQLTALIHPQIVGAARAYLTPVAMKNERFPLLVFSNRVSDGLIHTATSVRRARPGKPHSRPFTFVNILHADRWQLAG